MALSEREQRLLEEMERNLYTSDADFVATVRGAGLRPNYRFIVIGALLALLGIVGILVGVVMHLMVVGVLGFVVLLLGAVLATRSGGLPRSSADAPQPGAKKPAASNSFMGRMNDRWDRRQQL